MNSINKQVLGGAIIFLQNIVLTEMKYVKQFYEIQYTFLLNILYI